MLKYLCTRRFNITDIIVITIAGEFIEKGFLGRGAIVAVLGIILSAMGEGALARQEEGEKS